MRKILFVPAILLAAYLAQPATGAASPPRPLQPGAAGGIPVYFEPNVGQAAERVKFMARLKGASLYLDPSGTTISLATKGEAHQRSPAHGGTPPESADHATISMELLGANPSPPISGEGLLTGKIHYLVGRNEAGWRTHIPTYARVRYREIYPGVDLVFHTRNGRPEYDFELAAGVDPATIRLAFGGHQGMRLDADGNLVISTRAGDIVQSRPTAYQAGAGVEKALPAGFQLIDQARVAITVAGYDRAVALRIDPEIIYSTYLGGSGNDYGQAVAVDEDGYAYVVGFTGSSDLPTTPGVYAPAWSGGYDGFVAKLAPAGDDLVYLTYIGGSGHDYLTDVATDSAGNAHVVGATNSADFPTEAAFQGTLGGAYDGIVARLSADGSALVYSSYLGGGGNDFALGVALGTDESAHVTGWTDSENDTFPVTPGAFQSESACEEAYIASVDTTGALVYCSYLGGSGDDAAWSVVLDADDNAYVVGDTCSPDFPTTEGAYKTVFTSCDAFVTRFSFQTNDLAYSTYLGGLGGEWGTAIALDSDRNAYVVGTTSSVDFPTTPDAWLPTAMPYWNGYIAKLDPVGSTLLYGSYIGGSNYDHATSVAVDAGGHAVIAGWTLSTDLPLVAPVDDTAENWEAYVVRLAADGTGPLFSSYLGGSDFEADDPSYQNARPDVALDVAGAAYVAGPTRSADFPVTPGAYQETLPGGLYWAAYVTKIRMADEDLIPPACVLIDTGTSLQGTKQVELTVQDEGSGLATVDVIDTEKMTVDTGGFTPGTTDPVTVMVTRTSETGSATARLGIEDLAGNIGPCDVADVAIGRGPGTVNFDDVSHAQEQVSLINGDPGLKKLDILVNDETFPVQGLRDNVFKALDISSALIEGDLNTVILKGKGRTGQSCAVVISGGE